MLKGIMQLQTVAPALEFRISAHLMLFSLRQSV